MIENYETTNIHLKWLEVIFNQLKRIQDFERLANEGCLSIIDYFQYTDEYYNVLLPEIQYKNLRFLLLEMNMLIKNLSPILKKDEKEEKYLKKLEPVNNSINNRKLFLTDIKQNNKLIKVIPKPFLYKTISYLNEINRELTNDIKYLLYIPESENKKR